MRISLDQVRVGPVRWDETLEIPAESLAVPELLELSPVHCAGAATFVDPRFHLHADLGYVQKLQCDRCLEPFDLEVATRFDLVLEQAGEGERSEPAPRAERHPARGRGAAHEESGRVEAAAEEEAELQLEEDDFGVVRIAGDEVATEPLVTEQILLNLPMKPLCKPDCAGLCPTCGADRNVEPCDCEPPADARWAGLEAWLEKRT